MRIFMIIIFGLILVSGCASGNDSPVLMLDEEMSISCLSGSEQHWDSSGILGVYDLKINFRNQTAELTPGRNVSIGESYLVNGMGYFITFPCSNCFNICGIGFDFDKVILDFNIDHPMEPGDTGQDPSGINRLDLDIFDLALVVQPLGHTPEEFELTDQSIYPDIISSPDGYTSELSNIIGDQAALPYILLVDDSEISPPAITYNKFEMGASHEFEVGFLNELGETLQFELYLTFSYGASATRDTRLNPVYYNPEFNRKAAWKVEASPHNSWFSFDSSMPVNIEVKVYDWQIGANVDSALTNITDIYEASDVESISIEIPGMHDTLQTFPGNQYTSGTGMPSDPLIYNLPIVNENNLPGGEYTGIVKVTDQRQPKIPTDGRDYLVNSPDGKSVEPYQLQEFSTFQTFQALVSEEIVFNPVDVTPPWLNISSKDVDVVGNYAYTAAGYTGIHVFDVSDPENIDWVSMIDTPGSAANIHMQNGYAYVADSNHGALIIDVDPLDSMHIVKSFTQSSSIQEFYPDGDYGYIAAGMEMYIVSIQDPEAAEIVSTLDVQNNVQAVYASGDFAYLCEYSAGLDIIDVQDPSNPTILNHVAVPGIASDCIVRDGFAYIAEQDWPGHLHIINVSDPPTASIVKSVEIGDHSTNVFLSGEYAYLISNYQDLKIVDIDPVDSASVVETVNVMGIVDVSVQGQYAFATNSGGLQSVYLEPPASSHLVDTYDAMSGFKDFDVYQDNLIVSRSRLTVVDVSNPAMANIVNNFDTPSGRSYGIDVDGDLLYLCEGAQFSILDITSIENPQIVATLNDSYTLLYDMCFNNGYVYTPDYLDTIRVFDVDPPQSLESIATLDLVNNCKNICSSGSYLYVIDDYTLNITDISNPTLPVIVNAFVPGLFRPLSADVDNDYAYVGCRGRAFIIVDVNPPLTAEVLKTVNLPDDGDDVSAVYGYAFIASGNCVAVTDVDPVDQAHVELVIGVPEGNTVKMVHVQNGFAYIGLDMGGGIRIIDLW
jgi:hypothetical protein